jgi:hypothetical protein
VAQTLLGKELYAQKRLLNAWRGYDYRQAVMPETLGEGW